MFDLIYVYTSFYLFMQTKSYIFLYKCFLVGFEILMGFYGCELCLQMAEVLKFLKFSLLPVNVLFQFYNFFLVLVSIK